MVDKSEPDGQVRHGVKQASNTAEVLRAAYFEYRGVDREVRLDNLREVIAFHSLRASRASGPGFNRAGRLR